MQEQRTSGWYGSAPNAAVLLGRSWPVILSRRFIILHGVGIVSKNELSAQSTTPLREGIDRFM